MRFTCPFRPVLATAAHPLFRSVLRLFFALLRELSVTQKPPHLTSWRTRSGCREATAERHEAPGPRFSCLRGRRRADRNRICIGNEDVLIRREKDGSGSVFLSDLLQPLKSIQRDNYVQSGEKKNLLFCVSGCQERERGNEE